MSHEIFKKVKCGEITRTHDFQVEQIRRGTNDGEKFQTYLSLISLISNKEIEGDEVERGPRGSNFINLKPTKEGLKLHEFLSTPYDKIGKPSIFEVIRNGILGAISGRLAIWMLVIVGAVLLPTLNEDASAFLKNALEHAKGWFSGKV
ncbi:hypothetical protein [Microbulbifer sp. SAOS-129_SWC]|uniref:hypothetical protein n=1 Tax=Microbulbifer sp. SAOS-129_SWC TaxID=3145235 RepID=UPI0032169FE7